MTVFDLRSDILTRPTEAMIDAMIDAARRPACFGFREDPSVRALEERAAALLGKEDSLFLPTCTMANQIAVRLACAPGTNVIADQDSHIATTEEAATNGLSSVVLVRLRGENGHPAPEQIADALEDARHDPWRRTRLVVLENTHNRAGGTVMPTGWQSKICKLAKAQGISVHLDGARIWHASAHDNKVPAELAQDVDTVAVSLNKALGAPLGALLAGSRLQIIEADRTRVMLGGGWRPAGVLAAAALVAMETMRERIAQDHDTARALAKELAEVSGLTIDPTRVQTNIIMVAMQPPITDCRLLIADLGRKGVHVLPSGNMMLRVVTHYGLNQADLGEIKNRFKAAVDDVSTAIAGSLRGRN